ncbi:hypothetical protein BDV3_002492 [Batrachochytrium dendrobatidis]|nr:porphobilinogen deaminase [Batrachochytrium dendrobatidis JEL423]
MSTHNKVIVTDFSKTNFTIGTRESQLAMIQTTHVQALLKQQYPQLTFDINGMTTTGDQVQDVALSKIGTKSLFTKELEMALDDHSVDFVVHSLKDLPTQLPSGMMVGAILEREQPNDVVIMSLKHSFTGLAQLPAGSIIGTSSVRRSAQLKRRFPNLVFQDIRGNLNTRLKKLDDPASPFAAILLAYAGIHRMGWTDRITEILPTVTILHAVGQGAIGIECRENDTCVRSLLAPLNHTPTRIRCTAERSFMRSLEGGCSVPLGVSTSIEPNDTGIDVLCLTGSVTSLDGSIELRHAMSMDLDSEDIEEKVTMAHKLGTALANVLIERGAKDVLDAIRHA